MFRRLFDQIVRSISQPESNETDPAAREQSIRRATAVLMLDVALADKTFSQSELDHLRVIAESHFGLGPEEAIELIEEARNDAEELVSLYEFTQLLHQHLSKDEKARIIGMLWQIAYADGKLDKYENSLVLKISDLLYVSRGRVMRLKHDAARTAR